MDQIPEKPAPASGMEETPATPSARRSFPFLAIRARSSGGTPNEEGATDEPIGGSVFRRVVSLRPGGSKPEISWSPPPAGPDSDFLPPWLEDILPTPPKYTARHLRLGLWMIGALAAISGCGLLFVVGVTSYFGAQRSPTPELRWKILQEQIVQSKFRDAWTSLEGLRKAWPKDPRIHQAEGALNMLDHRNYDFAAACFAAALELDPGNPELIFYLAEALFAAKRYAEAETHYRLVSQSWKENEILPFRYYLCAALQGDRPRAKEVLNSPELGYASPSWLYIRATEAYWKRETHLARQYVAAAHQLHPGKTRMFDLTLEELGFP